MKKFKCEVCGDIYTKFEKLVGHISDEHSDQIPPDWTPAQYNFSLRNNGKTHGTCQICKRDTGWNEESLRYRILCPRKECKDKYITLRNNRMIGVHGKVHLLNDPDHQRKMLANRSISGKYTWSDGVQIGYTGSYELDFLKFLDVFLNFESSDIISPSPNTYYYEYEGKTLFYIPDHYIVPLNTEIEIKDGGDNPNMHHKIQDVDKIKEKLKDDLMRSQIGVNYVKLIDKKYDLFFELLLKLKEQYSEGEGSNKKPSPIILIP